MKNAEDKKSKLLKGDNINKDRIVMIYDNNTISEKII